MTYRKINVDNRDYLYVVGKTHVKIKGVGIWEKDKVGAEVNRGLHSVYIVSPSIIAGLISGVAPEKIYVCKHTATTKWAYDPYSYEIHGEKVKVANCPTCLHSSAMDV